MNGRRHLPRRVGLWLLAVLVLGAVITTSASAARPRPTTTTTPTTRSSTATTPRSPITRGSSYLALGDSVTFGYQESTVIPAPDYSRAADFLGYPDQLGAALHLNVTNLACPGETSGSLINASSPSNGCETGYRKSFPLHVRYQGSQLATAVRFLRRHANVRLVSLMIGANDGLACQATTADHCTSPAEILGVQVSIGRNVKRILWAIRRQARYSGQLAIVNYYSLDYASAAISAQSAAVNTAMDAAARPFHVEIANGYGEFRLASLRFGSAPCLAGLITQLNGQVGSCGIHPSYAGQALLAQALEKAIRLKA